MNKKINESFSFLIKEYRRLKLKNNQKTISDEEKQTLRKLESFIGKKDE
jgi:hypothetical protein|tara:strand:+ start:292 stop:438 length:147 start_codon:yes stop_codon:yes gene_type:complete